jgi:hypothetical protein
MGGTVCYLASGATAGSVHGKVHLSLVTHAPAVADDAVNATLGEGGEQSDSQPRD